VLLGDDQSDDINGRLNKLLPFGLSRLLKLEKPHMALLEFLERPSGFIPSPCRPPREAFEATSDFDIFTAD
jgi:hypothetical protein